MKSPIYPCLWFDGKAKEAASYYAAVLPDSKIVSEDPMVVVFEASGQKFMCLNGGPGFLFNPSISFYSIMNSAEELKMVWDRLIHDGSALMPLDTYPWAEKYGWVKDRFGITWQLTTDKPEGIDQRYTPAFLFTGENFGKAEAAIVNYTSIFENSSIRFISRYGKEYGEQSGKINHAQFTLNGQLFIAMDSNLEHGFSFNEAISLVVECEDQDEIDRFWSMLSEGGQESQCGWLKDRFGVSWQIVPEILSKLMKDPEKRPRVIEAFMKMKKFDIEGLINA